MKTDLIVSCPHCGKEITAIMELEKGIDPIKEMIMKNLDLNANSYSFTGNVKCLCGKTVLATLTVTG